MSCFVFVVFKTDKYKYEFRKLHPIPMLFTIYFLGSFWESFCALLRLGLGQASETVPLGFGRWTNGAGHICIWDWEAVSRKASVRFAGDKGRPPRSAPHAATSSPIFFWIYCHVGFQGLQTNNKILLCPVPFQNTTVASLVRLHEIVSQESHPISFSWNTIETPTHIYTTYVYLYLYMKTYLSL
jgi:hypothetical protein